MNTSTFSHYDLELFEPKFSSKLTDLIIELESLRVKELSGSTHKQIFFQLKHLFHTLESIGSARIEGNNTTIAAYLETKISSNSIVDHQPNIIEIQNIEHAIEFIENTINVNPINRAYISELHKLVVSELQPAPKGEGDATPGEYRKDNIKILNSSHHPPDFSQVPNYMEELFSFINSDTPKKYDLLKVAMAHHRFVWTHPFRNGNGRTVRLLTYAMLVKFGFNLNIRRIINPTAIFCNDRNLYYDMLAKADSGTEQGISEWCEYVLTGLKSEIEKIDKLTDYNFLKENVLKPAIEYSLKTKVITDIEFQILNLAIDKQVIQNVDLEGLFINKAKSEISRQIKKLIDKKMLMNETDAKRKYTLRFDNNYLIRGITIMLDKNGFLPIRDEV